MKFCVIVSLVLVLLSVSVRGQRTRIVENPHSGGSATVEYTEQGVPFITAQNEEDLFYTQGLVVAENRIWQMEIFRRWGLGTLAEVFPNALDLDKQARRMQWRSVCNENINNTPQLYLDRIQYYLNGVNGFLNAAQADPSLMPPEFAQYGAPFPASYEVIDTFIIVKVLATGLSGDARSEPRNLAMLEKLGQSRFDQYFALDPDMPYVVPPYVHSNYSRAGSDVPLSKAIIPDDVKEATCPIEVTEDMLPFFGRDYEKEEHLKSSLGDFLKAFNPPEFTRASNNWAIHGEHTTTGLPLVANDPHLPYLAPSIWVIVGLHIDAPDSDWNHVVGATLVLAPGIGIGRNDHISWGYTMVQSDNQDLFIMENLPGDRTYKYNGTVLPYEISWEYIEVKDAEPYNITLYRSVYGPTIPDSDGTFYSLKWTAQDAIEPSVEAIMDQCTAKTTEEYLEACGKWWSLCFNGVYGDVDGNIGYHATGAIPQRVPGDNGRIPKIGDGSMDWLGITPYEALANFQNPEEGFIVTANNPTAPVGSSEHIVGTFAVGFRAQRIIDMIVDRINSDTPLLDVDYMSSIQGSVVNLEFSYLYSTVKNLQLTAQDDLDWQQQLLTWDGNELIDSKEATVFDDFAACLYNVTFYEVGFKWDDPNMMASIFNNATVSGSGDDPACGYWNTTCLSYASSCFSSVVAKYPIRVPEWGSIPHYAVAVHILPVPVNENLFAAVGGSEYTPNAAHSVGGPRGPVLAGPSMRFISDLSGQTPNQMVLPGGESGDPTSPHYADQLPFWAEVQTLDMDWNQFSSSK